MISRIKQCENCRNGVQGITCMADIDPDGLCPIADRAPRLWACNDISVSIFSKAQNSSTQVSAKDKVYLYLRLEDIRNLMQMYKVPILDQEETMERVQIIEGIANRLRPIFKKTKVK